MAENLHAKVQSVPHTLSELTDAISFKVSEYNEFSGACRIWIKIHLNPKIQSRQSLT
jgi:hypothetical protein